MTLHATKRNGAGYQKYLLGELMIADGLITSEQLQLSLKRQTQEGESLGTMLIEMGFIAVEDLLNLLGKRYGVPAVNLFKVNIRQEVLRVLTLERIQSSKILPLSVGRTTLTLAMVNPQDFQTIRDLEFSVGKTIKPVVAPSFMMNAAIHCLSACHEDGLQGEMIERLADTKKMIAAKTVPDIQSLLKYMVKSGASDMLLTGGVPPSLKIANEVKRLVTAPLTPHDCEAYAREILPVSDWERFEQKQDHDFGFTYPSVGRFRASVYRQRNSVSIALRGFPETLPSLEELNLPGWLTKFALKPHGMILICGPAGHGKTTTLSAMVDIINTHRRCNIITFEDPVEYLHKHKKSNINQREVGRDTESFYSGLKSVFRQAPDVIIIGEMRDKESYEIALHAAYTGHLVISTVHAENATTIIDRIINMFPSHQQTLIRMMLADCLILSIAQRLVPNKEKNGRVLAFEKLINSYRMKNHIREANSHKIRSQMQMGTEDFTSLDLSLAKLVKEGKIHFEDGLAFAENESLYRDLSEMKYEKLSLRK